MIFSVGIVVIASTFLHYVGQPSMYSSLNVDSSLARLHHSLRALSRPALPLKVRASRPEKTLNIRRNKKILLYKELFVD
jgi:hypothetical protein